MARGEIAVDASACVKTAQVACPSLAPSALTTRSLLHHVASHNMAGLPADDFLEGPFASGTSAAGVGTGVSGTSAAGPAP